MSERRFAWAVTLASFMAACSAAPDGSAPGPAAGPPVRADIEGRAQKGPFASGTRITIAELDANLVQTGRTFSATLRDDEGSFVVRAVELGTPYARVEADGYYFDEVRGELSEAPLRLFSYVDFSDRTTININVLGHLEAARLEYLVTERGRPFADAKAQAHREVLAMFELAGSSIDDAETLDISRGGEANATLFTISVILQGTRSVGELAELLSNIQSDLAEDGTLDDRALGAALMAGASTVNPESVRENLAAYFAELGVTADVPDVASTLEHFRESTDYELGEGGITYPNDGVRINVLTPGLTSFRSNAGDDFGFVADLPDASEVMIRMTNTTPRKTISHPEHGTIELPRAVWGYAGGGAQGWIVSLYDDATGVQEFRASNEGIVDLEHFAFTDSGSAVIEYFEYGSEKPTETLTKTITWSTTSQQPPAGGAGGSTAGSGGTGGGSGSGAGAGGAAGMSHVEPLCGNGVVDVESGEACDPRGPEGDCAEVIPGSIGKVICEPDCRWNTDHCSTCGNGIREELEACDGPTQDPCRACNAMCQWMMVECDPR